MQAQTVTFTNLNDAVPSRFFNAAGSGVDPVNRNRLIVAFNTGRDPATLRANAFRASTEAFNHSIAMDTLRVLVTAPRGFYISRVTYNQRGAGSVARTGAAAGASTWVVGGRAGNVGVFSTNPALTRTMDITGLNLTSVPVSITTSLYAFATPRLGSATLAVTGADLFVQVLPLR